MGVAVVEVGVLLLDDRLLPPQAHGQQSRGAEANWSRKTRTYTCQT
ncbi:hypothetical protein RB628_32030 [Streptomyces sp. ADMS]|nr:hypothetical protein [Streptomyces sp. ADMS]MDW4909840.1 hypothetical protein [Streptomyces sp. ADMS]